MTSTPSYAIVTVTHNSADELSALLASLQRWLSRPPTQLIVADTGSTDASRNVAQSGGAHVIELPENPGFGAANNAAIAHVTAPVTVLLNPDCALRDGIALPALIAAAATVPTSLHAPGLRNADGSVQRSAHPLPGTLGAFVPAVLPPRALPRPLAVRAEPFRGPTPRTVGWVIAAALAAPTELLRSLGPFDPAIHLFAEDLDLCLRARAAGAKTVLHPQLALDHVGGHSTLRDNEPFEALAAQRRAVIARRLGPGPLRRDDFAQALTFSTRIAAKAALRQDTTRERAQLSALQASRRSTPRPSRASAR